MSLPPINLPPKQDALFVVHVRHRRYQHESRAPDPEARTPASWGTIRVRVKRLRDGDAPAPGVPEVEQHAVKDSFRKWWWAMADRFPKGTPPEELCFDFDMTWSVRIPGGDDAVMPWVGTFDDRDWELDPVESMKTIRGRLVEVMKGITPESNPPAYVDWSVAYGNAQQVWNSYDDWENAATDDEGHSQ